MAHLWITMKSERSSKENLIRIKVKDKEKLIRGEPI